MCAVIFHEEATERGPTPKMSQSTCAAVELMKVQCVTGHGISVIVHDRRIPSPSRGAISWAFRNKRQLNAKK